MDPTAWLPASQLRGQDWGTERWLSEKSLKGNSCIRAEDGEGEEEKERYILFTPNLPASLLFAFLLQTVHYLHPLQNGISSHLNEFHGFLSTIPSIFLFFKLTKYIYSVLNICPFFLKSLIKFYQTGLSWY